MDVMPATEKTDLVTIGSQENTTWNKYIRPLYRAICKYINNYGWMDLVLVSTSLKEKVNTVEIVDLKNPQGKSVTEHESVATTFNNVFKNK